MNYITNVSVEIHHDSLETLEITMQEVKEIMQYMTNIKRKFKVSVGRTDGEGRRFYTNIKEMKSNDDGQNK